MPSAAHCRVELPRHPLARTGAEALRWWTALEAKADDLDACFPRKAWPGSSRFSWSVSRNRRAPTRRRPGKAVVQRASDMHFGRVSATPTPAAVPGCLVALLRPPASPRVRAHAPFGAAWATATAEAWSTLLALRGASRACAPTTGALTAPDQARSHACGSGLTCIPAECPSPPTTRRGRRRLLQQLIREVFDELADELLRVETSNSSQTSSIAAAARIFGFRCLAPSRRPAARRCSALASRRRLHRRRHHAAPRSDVDAQHLAMPALADPPPPAPLRSRLDAAERCAW